VLGQVVIPVGDAAWAPGQALPEAKAYPLTGHGAAPGATLTLRLILVAEPEADAPLKVLVGTWNAGNAAPDENLLPWLRNEGDAHELVAVGAQECTYTQRAPHASCDADWNAAIGAPLGPGYTRVVSESLGQMRLSVYARFDTLAGIQSFDAGAEATGLGHVHTNKGGVGVVVTAWDTSCAFMNSHLAAHQNKTKRRNEDYGEIVSGCVLGEKGMDCMNQFHHLIWMGDLNYRLDFTELFGEEAATAKTPPPELFDEIQKLVDTKALGPLLASDQLVRARERGDAWVGFQEGDICHEPTFKVKRAVGFEYNKQRSPAYCDRILWRSLPGVEARQEALWAAPQVASSDHKPVGASMALGRRPARPAWAPRRDCAGVRDGMPRASHLREASHAAHGVSVPTWTLTLTSLFGHGLMAADYNGKSDPYVAFMGAALPKMAVTQVVFATLDPHWSPEKLPKIRLAAASEAALAHEHILVNVVDYDSTSADDPIGCGVMHLGQLMAACAEGGGGEADFEVPLTFAGVAQGKLSGRLRITPGPPMSAADFAAAKSRTRRIAPKKSFSVRRALGLKKDPPITIAPHASFNAVSAAPAAGGAAKGKEAKEKEEDDDEEEDD
jgi:hypothetical protein